MADSPETDSERLDLSAFEVPPVPEGLADRVLARLPATAPRPPPRHWGRVAVAAVLLLALPGFAGWAVRHFGPPETGGRDFTRRETVRLGASALAVAEPGTTLHWVAGRRGTVRVRQPVGRVFYRVESGSDFQVETPSGQVAVRGTCFTIEVQPMLPSKQTLTGAAVGSLLTAAVFVTVHEGRVSLTSTAGATEVGAGERAVLSAGAAPRVLAAPAVGDTAVASAPKVPTSGEQAAPPSWQARESAYVAELTTLRARVKELEQSASGGTRPVPGSPESEKKGSWLEPSQEELLEMAQKCQLRWDAPTLRPKMALKPSPEELAKLGMTEDEVQVVAEVHDAFVQQSVEQLRAIYVAATGDVDNSRVLSPDALQQEILDKSTEESIRRAFQRISQERAGLAAPPADTTGLPPAERLARLNTGLGDGFERALAEKLGASRARDLRALRGGWSSKHSSSQGCPSQP